jgi:hypothetical protein
MDWRWGIREKESRKTVRLLMLLSDCLVVIFTEMEVTVRGTVCGGK